MPNGKAGDGPLTDFVLHGSHPFPADIEDLLRRIETLGRAAGRWPLGENWPFSTRDFDWATGRDLDGARGDLRHLFEMLEKGRGDEVLLDPRTRRPLEPSKTGA